MTLSRATRTFRVKVPCFAHGAGGGLKPDAQGGPVRRHAFPSVLEEVQDASMLGRGKTRVQRSGRPDSPWRPVQRSPATHPKMNFAESRHGRLSLGVNTSGVAACVQGALPCLRVAPVAVSQWPSGCCPRAPARPASPPMPFAFGRRRIHPKGLRRGVQLEEDVGLGVHEVAFFSARSSLARVLHSRARSSLALPVGHGCAVRPRK